jgi:hypothetical protein
MIYQRPMEGLIGNETMPVSHTFNYNVSIIALKPWLLFRRYGFVMNATCDRRDTETRYLRTKNVARNCRNTLSDFKIPMKVDPRCSDQESENVYIFGCLF